MVIAVIAEQAEKGGNAEGFSIPAQREANQRKADQLGATIVEEFVDAGESARKADRPELMRMIQYVTRHKTNYCIVHKVDRLARNRADDVTIHLALKDAGVTLVSATENIDETPSGMLLHGIMSSIAEFYSRNLATEVVKGLSQKAAQGGTVTRAPIGYRNVGVRDEFGREVRTVEIDQERAPLVRWAFQVFASGDWTTSQLHRELLARVGDIYAHADDANRRLCNQALFTAIYLDEDNDVRVGYRSPYDGLANTDLQADALTWAAQARKQGQDRTPTTGGPLVRSSHPTHQGWLTGLEPAAAWTTTRSSTN